MENSREEKSEVNVSSPVNILSRLQRSYADRAVSGGTVVKLDTKRRVLLKELKVIEDLSGGIGVKFNRDLISEASVSKTSVEGGGKHNPLLSVFTSVPESPGEGQRYLI